MGRWIAVKLQDYGQDKVSHNVIKFIDQKEKSTLNPCRVSTSLNVISKHFLCIFKIKVKILLKTKCLCCENVYILKNSQF